ERAQLRGVRVRAARGAAGGAAQQRHRRPPRRVLRRRPRRGRRVPAGPRRPAAGRPRRQQERLGRAALAVFPRPLGDAVRAGQLPRRQGLRGRRRRAAVAPVTDNSVASDRIADTLRAAILDGSYLPGTRIRQEDVAARSGASRIPVREAFRLLASEGLVTLVANTGAWVTRLSLDECVETYLIRERLEPPLLRGALPHPDEAAIGHLAELTEAMAGTGPSVAEFFRPPP